jgi:PAS domain S-box-containing protein
VTQWLAMAVRASGLVAIAVALLVLASWPLELQTLRNLVAGGNSMKPITAMCLGLAGLSLWLLAPRVTRDAPGSSRRRLALAAAAVVMLTGVALLAEHVLQPNGSLGNLLFPASLAAPGVPNPGRPSIATALACMLLGLGLLTVDLELRGQVRPSELLALGVILLGLVGFQGYLLGMEALFCFPAYATMALHTSMLFLLLGIGLLHARPDRGLMATVTNPATGGLIARRLLPVAVIVPIVLAWPRLQGERLGYFETEVGLAIFATSNIIIFTVVIWLSARSLNRVDEARQLADASTRMALTELEQESAERSRAEAARASEERFAVAFQASPAGMVLSRLPGLEYVAVNDSWLAMTGYSRDDVIGQTSEQVGMIDPEARAAFYSQMGADSSLHNAELHLRTVSGEARHGLVSTQRLTVHDHAFQITTLVDITDRVRMEAEWRASNQRLETTLPSCGWHNARSSSRNASGRSGSWPAASRTTSTTRSGRSWSTAICCWSSRSCCAIRRRRPSTFEQSTSQRRGPLGSPPACGTSTAVVKSAIFKGRLACPI